MLARSVCLKDLKTTMPLEQRDSVPWGKSSSIPVFSESIK